MLIWGLCMIQTVEYNLQCTFRHQIKNAHGIQEIPASGRIPRLKTSNSLSKHVVGKDSKRQYNYSTPEETPNRKDF